MNRAELKAKAKAQLEGKVGKVFLCMLILVAVTLVAGMIPGIGSIVAYVVTAPISLGLCLVWLDMTYGREPEVGTLFKGFNYTGKSIWLTILIGVFTFLWTLLLYIPGIIKGLSYSMAFYILAENPNMTAREALNESKRITNGHKMDLFVLGLSFIPWLLLVTVTCGIAGIWVAPYMELTYTNFYHEIKNK